MNEAATAVKSNPWMWWRNALVGNRTPIDANSPEQGYYRAQDRNGSWKPVAYWWGDVGELWCAWGDRMLDPDLAIERWPWVSKNPVSEEDYNLVCRGGQWPDVNETVAEQLEASRERIGGNNPPQDPLEQLIGQIQSAAAAIEQYRDIGEDDEAAAKAAAGLRNRLNELGGEAEDARHKAIGDHYRLYKEAHDKWHPLVEDAKAAAKKLLGYLNAWTKKKAQKEADQRAAAEAAQRAAAKREQEEADRQIAAGVPPSAQEEPQESFAPPPEPVAPQPRPQIKSGYGRAAAIVTVKISTIDDQDKVYAAFRDYQEVKDVLAKLVRAAVKAGQTVEGVTVTEEQQVR